MRFRLDTLIYALLSLTLPTWAEGSSAARFCLQNALSVLSGHLAIEQKGVKHASVHVERRMNANGRPHFVMTLRDAPADTHTSWNSNYQVAPRAPQGDPRWLIRILGEAVANRFGVRLVERAPGKVELHAPSAEALDQVVLELNKRLPEKNRIRIRFYSSPPDSPQVSPRAYLDRFIKDQALPLADGSDLYIHDFSYHTSAIFYPPEVIDYSVRQARHLVKFLDGLKEHHPGFSANEMARIIAKIEAEAVNGLDAGLGDMAHSLGGASPVGYAYNTAYLSLTAAESSPNRFVLELVERTASSLSPETNHMLSKLARNFVEHSGKTDPSSEVGLKIDFDNFFERILEQRNAIQSAALPQ